MAASSKSSQKAKDVVLALLLLWSLVSLIIIVVWSTSPDWKGVAQCNKELQGTKEQLKMSTVTWNNNKVALEEKVEKTREEVEHKTAEIMLLQTHLNATNASLEECRQENVGLNKNISVLQENVEQLRQTEANLTAQLSQQEDHIDALQNNLTQAFHQTKACLKLQEAAKNQMFAAQSQTKACESQQQYVQKQLKTRPLHDDRLHHFKQHRGEHGIR
uniref:Si:ch211-1a19.3 n=1 Tax=Seriola dumerili TaxID=41447 RepID=A0A3B4VDG4_SERDU